VGRTIVTDDDATSDEEVVPDPDSFTDPVQRVSARRAIAYLGIKAGTPTRHIAVDTVFIGSCMNSRIEELRVAAYVARGRRVKPRVRTLVFPGSASVKHQGETEGLDRRLRDVGFDWREPG